MRARPLVARKKSRLSLETFFSHSRVPKKLRSLIKMIFLPAERADKKYKRADKKYKTSRQKEQTKNTNGGFRTPTNGGSKRPLRTQPKKKHKRAFHHVTNNGKIVPLIPLTGSTIQLHKTRSRTRFSPYPTGRGNVPKQQVTRPNTTSPAFRGYGSYS